MIRNNRYFKQKRLQAFTTEIIISYPGQNNSSSKSQLCKTENRNNYEKYIIIGITCMINKTYKRSKLLIQDQNKLIDFNSGLIMLLAKIDNESNESIINHFISIIDKGSLRVVIIKFTNQMEKIQDNKQKLIMVALQRNGFHMNYNENNQNVIIYAMRTTLLDIYKKITIILIDKFIKIIYCSMSFSRANKLILVYSIIYIWYKQIVFQICIIL